MNGTGPTSPPGYEEAHASAARFDRSHRTRLAVSGRAPGQMLGGVVSGTIPAAAAERDGHLRGMRHYSTVLTPKGRMVSDLYLVRVPGTEERFVLDVSPAGRAGVLDHFKRVLPPRLAKVEDTSSEIAHATVVGPDAVAAVAAALSAIGPVSVDAANLLALDPDDVLFLNAAVDTPFVVRSADTALPGFDLFYSRALAGEVESALSDAGAAEGSAAAWQALRVEAGTPEFGADMTEETIPIEAGIEDRAIDGTKGCYTGQEVVVRILHRGHVNRHLRSLRSSADDPTPPAVGDELFADGSDKPVGRVTSLAYSGRAGAVLGLGYVRREVDVGSQVRAGGAGGPALDVLERGAVSSTL